MNVPSCCIFNKPTDKTPEQMLQQIIENTDFKTRTRGRMVKMFGKNFFKEIPKGTKEY